MVYQSPKALIVQNLLGKTPKNAMLELLLAQLPTYTRYFFSHQGWTHDYQWLSCVLCRKKKMPEQTEPKRMERQNPRWMVLNIQGPKHFLTFHKKSKQIFRKYKNPTNQSVFFLLRKHVGETSISNVMMSSLKLASRWAGRVKLPEHGTMEMVWRPHPSAFDISPELEVW